MKTSRSRFLELRGLRMHLREWGDEAAPLLVMLHGWMDVSASFQFVVDALTRDWHVVVPDWRGFGRSQWSGADAYAFSDYLGDLDHLLDALSPQAPIDLVGHSMGGNVGMLYAGVRPQRIRALVNLEGLGLKDTSPAMAPARYARWLEELKAETALRDYASVEDVAVRLRRNNPRLSAARAAFLAPHWSEQLDSGRYRIAGDPAHKRINPTLYRWAEIAACWSRITAPVLWVEAQHHEAHAWSVPPSELPARRAVVPNLRFEVVTDAGHMVHHDQPGAVAQLIERFIVA